jgi:hypothetical protein
LKFRRYEDLKRLYTFRICIAVRDGLGGFGNLLQALMGLS